MNIELFPLPADLAWPLLLALARVDTLGSSAALAHIERITHEGSDAGFLRRQHRECGSAEGMVEAAIAAFRGEAAGPATA